MAEPYTIRILVPAGNPEGVKIVELLNWTGIGVAFPRSAWPEHALWNLTTSRGKGQSSPTEYIAFGGVTG